MLKELRVKNLAIIEDIDVVFQPKMTVFTGQTGAGKSLIIDAIGLLIGARADTDLIRYGEKESIVEGTFVDVSEQVKAIVTEYGIAVNEQLIITRKITNSGKSSVKVNDTPITIQQLKKLGLYLGDIHVQHDTYRLINKENYLSFLDDLKDQEFLKVYNDYQVKRMNYLEQLAKYENIQKKNTELNKQLDFLAFQKEELAALNLEKDCDIKLESEIAKLANFDKIYNNLNSAYYHLDNEHFSLDELYNAQNDLSLIADFDEDYQQSAEILLDAYYQIEEIKSKLFHSKDKMDFDPNYLDELNNRLFAINKVKEKYHKSVAELLDYLQELELELSLITNYEETMDALKKEVINAFEKVKKAALFLSSYRKKVAKQVSQQLIAECQMLDLEQIAFEISFKDSELADPFDSTPLLDKGIDDVDFLISFNIGEPVKPLSKVASGGELSRLMLAFKIIYLAKNDLSFMVFDEIDSGISGSTARKIAKKMAQLSEKVQVLAITHLAQVASISDNQLCIYKTMEDNRTKTIVKNLTYEERITEIATMLSGMEISTELLQTAKSMLDNR